MRAQYEEIKELDKKIAAAIEQGHWETVIDIEKERSERIQNFFTAVTPLEKTIELKELISDMIQNTKLLHDKIKQQQDKVGKTLTTFYYGKKMKQAYKSNVQTS